MVAFKRSFGRGDKGSDVKAVKRALRKSKDGGPGLIVKTASFGPAAVRALKRFQARVGLAADGVYGPLTHSKLSPFFDKFGESLYLKQPVDPPALTKVRELLAFCRTFDNTYVWGGNHDGSLTDDNPHQGFDCSSSTSFALWKFGLLPVEQAEVSGWFESYGDPGRGTYLTVHASGDHVWLEFSLPEGYFRFDTSPHGDGPRGPRVRTLRRFDTGFVHRHPKGF